MIRPRVLVVDPDPAGGRLIRKVLARHCDLVFQTDPLRTLDLFQIFEPDLTILELMLPSLSGFELLGLIGAADPQPAPRLLVFSAKHDVESQKMAYRLGANVFLAKSCRPSQLFKATAMFVRARMGVCPVKRLDMEQVNAAVVRLDHGRPLHPLTATALAMHRQREQLAGAHPSLLASIAHRRPAARI